MASGPSVRSCNTFTRLSSRWRCRCWPDQPRRRVLTDCQDRIPRTRLRPEDQSRFAKDLDAYQDALAVKGGARQRPERGMKTSSRDQGRAAVICFESGRSAAGE